MRTFSLNFCTFETKTEESSMNLDTQSGSAFLHQIQINTLFKMLDLQMTFAFRRSKYLKMNVVKTSSEDYFRRRHLVCWEYLPKPPTDYIWGRDLHFLLLHWKRILMREGQKNSGWKIGLIPIFSILAASLFLFFPVCHLCETERKQKSWPRFASERYYNDKSDWQR